MPYWNRAAALTRSLDAYRKVYPDLDLEFSIADDGSAEKPIVPQRNPKYKVTTLPRKARAMNPCVPINAAIRAATSDIIVLTNPEIEHREPVLQSMLAALQSTDDYVMTGCRNVGFTRRSDLRTQPSGEWIAGPDAPRAPVGGRQPIPPGTYLHFCVMFHRSLWERVGGFDEEYRKGVGCDDNDWLWSLYALGDVNFTYVPGVVWHHLGTRCMWHESVAKNADRLREKWGHMKEFQCA
jgi:GT2 family glycosyltransferase